MRTPDLISQDDNPVSQARRRRAVEADAALRATGEPCPGCGQWARTAGGTGCTCRTSLSDVIGRVLAHADAARQGVTG